MTERRSLVHRALAPVLGFLANRPRLGLIILFFAVAGVCSLLAHARELLFEVFAYCPRANSRLIEVHRHGCLGTCPKRTTQIVSNEVLFAGSSYESMMVHTRISCSDATRLGRLAADIERAKPRNRYVGRIDGCGTDVGSDIGSYSIRISSAPGQETYVYRGHGCEGPAVLDALDAFAYEVEAVAGLHPLLDISTLGIPVGGWMPDHLGRFWCADEPYGVPKAPQQTDED